MRVAVILASIACLVAPPAGAQTAAATAVAASGPAKPAVRSKKKPVAAKPPAVPAKQLFGAVKTAANMKPRAIGFYAKGCLAGGQALPIDGPAWQVMRLSRNRNWGHPRLIGVVERLARDARQHDGWPGLLVGDMSQPRGGPMLTGHASHQIGLDADIWFTPMPDHRMTRDEREKISAVSMLGPDKLSVDPKVWSESRMRLLKRAASYAEVERIFVHPAIKKALCEETKADKDRGWLSKVRPYWGHYYHFHVRLECPAGVAGCEHQAEPANDDGCGKELDHWFALLTAPPKPPGPPKPPAPPKPQITLDQLPADCRAVLNDGATPAVAAPAKGKSAPAAIKAAPAAVKAETAKPATARQ